MKQKKNSIEINDFSNQIFSRFCHSSFHGIFTAVFSSSSQQSSQMFSWQFSQNLHGGFHSVFTTVFTDVCTYDLICTARVDRMMFALSDRRIHIFDRATCHNVYTLCKHNLPNTYSNCRETMRSAHTVVWSSIESYWQLISGRNICFHDFSHMVFALLP